MKERIKIIPNDDSQHSEKVHSKHSRYREKEAKLEREWLEKKNTDSSKSILERSRIERILKMIPTQSLEGKRVADIGCGSGKIAEKLCQSGAICDACDIATNALKQIPPYKNLTRKKASLPETKLEDNAYDLIVCCDTIAELDPRDYRLAMAELCRILKLDGKVILSTPLDIYSEDSLEQFIKLAETEFLIMNTHLSYHYLFIKCSNLLNAPHKYWKAYRQKQYRKEKLSKLSSFSKFWFQWNSSALLAWFWGGFQWIPLSIQKGILERKAVFNMLEKISKLVWDLKAVTYIILIAKRKPLLSENENLPPRPDRAPFIKEKQWT